MERIKLTLPLINKYWNKKKMVIFFLTFLISSLVSLIFPYLFSNVIDLYLENELSQNIIRIVTILVFQLLLVLIKEGYGYLKTIYAFEVDLSMKIDFLRALQNKNLFFTQTKHSGEIQFRMFSDISTIVNTVFIFLVELPVLCVLVFVAVLIISKVNLIFMIFSLVMMGIMVLQFTLFQEPLKRTIENTKNINQSITGELNEHFDQLEIIGAYNFKNTAILKFDSRFKELFNTFKKQNKLLTFGSCSSQVIFQLWIGGIFLIDVILLAKGAMDITSFVIVFMYANMVPTLWTTLISIIWRWQDYSVSLNRYFDYYSNNNEVLGEEKINKINSITCRSLSFSYNEKKVLSDISFSTKMNKLFMILGENGTGKTTLIKIITKQLSVSSDQLFINGIDINMIDNESLRDSISLVTQVPYIINGSIKENILMGVGNYDLEKFNTLIELLGIDKLAMKLGVTLNDNIYDEKILLSGGEKQKINLARALIKHASVVILDEPFRNLDNETCNNLRDYIINSKKDFCYIVITHDHVLDDFLSSNDEILYLKKEYDIDE